MGQASGCCAARDRDNPQKPQTSRLNVKRASAALSSTALIDPANAAEALKADMSSFGARYRSQVPIRDHFLVEDTPIGYGRSGDVLVAKQRSTERKYALKSRSKLGMSQAELDFLKNEVEVYLSVDHPHIAKLEYVYEDDAQIHLVMELMTGGDLAAHVESLTMYSEAQAATAACQMLRAVRYLHGRRRLCPGRRPFGTGLIYRGITLSHFLYESRAEDAKLKLIDIGLRQRNPTDDVALTQQLDFLYTAPEVLTDNYDELSDMWSLGIIVYTMLTGSPPYTGHLSEVQQKVLHGAIDWSSKFSSLSQAAQDFVQSLLAPDPRNRASSIMALDDPWLACRFDNSPRMSAIISKDTLRNLRRFVQASRFERLCLSLMAWSLDSATAAELRDKFVALDKAGTGTITAKQIAEVLKESIELSDSESQELLNSIDSTTHGAEIPYTDFLAANLSQQVLREAELIRATFERFDADGCGEISAGNVAAVLGEHYRGSAAEMMIQEADCDGNGRLDIDEFELFMRSALTRKSRQSRMQARQSILIHANRASRLSQRPHNRVTIQETDESGIVTTTPCRMSVSGTILESSNEGESRAVRGGSSMRASRQVTIISDLDSQDSSSVGFDRSVITDGLISKDNRSCSASTGRSVIGVDNRSTGRSGPRKSGWSALR